MGYFNHKSANQKGETKWKISGNRATQLERQALVTKAQVLKLAAELGVTVEAE